MELIISKNLSLLEALALLSPDSSKNSLRLWLEQGRVMVQGKVIKSGKHAVSSGEKVALGPRKIFVARDIEILYEDRDLVVLLKPAGLLSVATNFDLESTAHTVLKRRCNHKVTPVHRLDRETSGVMVFAYTDKVRDGLKRQFQEHTIEREYCAIVEGKMESPSGKWVSYLVEDEHYHVQSTPRVDQGRLAVTHYETLSENARYTCLRLRLETGRKNQIRVHCKEAGHPIAGDEKYGAKTNPVKRVCLHARKLGFIHPASKKKLVFTVPLPEEFYNILSIKNI